MIHARDDYNRIQDPAHLIDDDEPVFLLRAQDKTAPAAVASWAELQYRLGGNREMARLALDHAERMQAWQVQHPERVKVADMPAPDAPVVMPKGMDLRQPVALEQHLAEVSLAAGQALVHPADAPAGVLKVVTLVPREQWARKTDNEAWPRGRCPVCGGKYPHRDAFTSNGGVCAASVRAYEDRVRSQNEQEAP